MIWILVVTLLNQDPSYIGYTDTRDKCRVEALKHSRALSQTLNTEVVVYCYPVSKFE